MTPTSREIRALWKLALPIILTNLGTMLMGTVDTLMVSRFSTEALAAATLANVWIHGTTLFAMGVVFGMDPIVSQAHGANDHERAAYTLQRGLSVALIVSIPLMILWAFTAPFLALSGQASNLIAGAHDYTLVQIPSVPFFMAFVAYRQYLQGREIVRPTLWVILFANLMNVVFNWILIFEDLGPLGNVGFGLGLEGAGIATGLTRGVMLLAILLVFRFGYRNGTMSRPWSKSSFALANLGEIMRHGWAIGVQMSLEVWAFAAATLMAGRLGELDVAAHAIVLNMASLSFMMPMGISFAAVTRVGNLIGAGRIADAQRASWVAFATGPAVMSVAALIFIAGRHSLPSLYTSDADVIALCASILPIAAAFQVFDGTQVVGCGVLRGMGDTKPAAWFNLLGYWVLAIPLAWWMTFRADLRLAGVWWGLALGLAVVAVLLVGWNAIRGPAHRR